MKTVLMLQSVVVQLMSDSDRLTTVEAEVSALKKDAEERENHWINRVVAIERKLS